MSLQVINAAIDEQMAASPVMRSYMGGLYATRARLKKWDQTGPAMAMAAPHPFNPQTQEALCYAWESGCLLACAQYIEEQLLKQMRTEVTH